MKFMRIFPFRKEIIQLPSLEPIYTVRNNYTNKIHKEKQSYCKCYR